MVNIKDVQQEIKGLQLVFIELPKFTQTRTNDPEFVAWIRYLTETDEPGSNPEALAVNRPEMEEPTVLGVRTQKMMLSDEREDGLKEGIQIGEEKARQARAKALEKLVDRDMSPEEARSILGTD